jgi:hypothetical protein
VRVNLRINKPVLKRARQLGNILRVKFAGMPEEKEANAPSLIGLNQEVIPLKNYLHRFSPRRRAR